MNRTIISIEVQDNGDIEGRIAWSEENGTIRLCLKMILVFIVLTYIINCFPFLTIISRHSAVII